MFDERHFGDEIGRFDEVSRCVASCGHNVLHGRTFGQSAQDVLAGEVFIAQSDD